MSQADAHYAGQLVDGARILALFGDVATELLIRHDGDEGLFRSYDSIDFVRPVYAGDYIEARGRIVRIGETTRSMQFAAYKVIQAKPAEGHASAAEVLDPPLLVVRAKGTCVVPASRQRGARPEQER
jgi:3-aminobutyryl-CoA ammonia-lyase